MSRTFPGELYLVHCTFTALIIINFSFIQCKHKFLGFTILQIHPRTPLSLSSGSQIRRIGRAGLPTTDYVCISADPFRSPSEGSIVGRSRPAGCFHESRTSHNTLSHHPYTKPASVKEVYSKLSSPEASLLTRSSSFNPPVCFHTGSADRGAA